MRKLGLLQSSIGKKAVVAATGLVLLGFVVIHVLGNLQIFGGPELINVYAKKLRDWPWVLWPVRVFLFLALAVHIGVATALAIENKRARPIAYVKKVNAQASYTSRTMVISGFLLLGFVVYHLLHFTLGVTHPDFFHLKDAQGRADVYAMMVKSFRDYSIAGLYGAAMIVLYLHLSHGIASFFQTLGIGDDRRRLALERWGRMLSLLIAIGYLSIPVAVLAGWIRLPGQGVSP